MAGSRFRARGEAFTRSPLRHGRDGQTAAAPRRLGTVHIYELKMTIVCISVTERKSTYSQGVSARDVGD
jgi:hypothetical protein